MKIAVIGLGIIGGSIAKSLKAYTTHQVDGWNRNEQVSALALEKGYIDGIVKDIKQYDVVFVALPPKVTLDYLTHTEFANNTIVSDICGVKSEIEKVILKTPRNFRYIGIHPMAGKETRGLDSATENMFYNANLIMIENEKTDKEAEEVIHSLAKEMRFGKIVTCSAQFHDEKIALTSQLAHIVSNAYVKSPSVKGYEGFTGGSFQDMTRIAGVDENVWTDLYQMNQDNLLKELNTLIDNLTCYQTALKEGDFDKMKALLKEGRLIRETIKNKKI